MNLRDRKVVCVVEPFDSLIGSFVIIQVPADDVLLIQFPVERHGKMWKEALVLEIGI